MDGKVTLTERNPRREKAVNSILRVMVENELTAGEIQLVLMDVNEAINLRPLTMDYVDEYYGNASKFRGCF